MTALQHTRALQLITQEMRDYRAARRVNGTTNAWSALERAHILSQPYLRPHLANHMAMLGFAVTLRDWREATGQVVRLALAPLGALLGRIPVGNTGRSNVSAFKQMPVPDDLRTAMAARGK